PRGAVEEMVAGIWGEVLKVEKVGREANFFEIGGHSLLATQVMSRMNGRFNLRLPLHVFFESPTVMGLAATIERQQSEQGETEQTGIQRVPRGEKSVEQLLAELDQLSESEIKALLADQGGEETAVRQGERNFRNE
ncbi:MAG: phosphopantetheine-binding protein, partial [Pyrinomonadaceae bacterium]